MKPSVSPWFPVFLFLAFLCALLPLSGRLTAWANAHQIHGLIPFVAPALLVMGGILLLRHAARRSPRPIVFVILVMAAGAFLYYVMMARFTQVPLERFHVLLFACLGILVHRGYGKETSGWRLYIYSAVFLACAGFVDEVIQGLMKTRLYDNRDIALNVGSGLLILVILGSMGMTEKKQTDTGSTKRDARVFLAALVVILGMLFLRRTPLAPERIVGTWKTGDNFGGTHWMEFTEEGEIRWHDDSGNWAKGTYTVVGNPFEEYMLSVTGTDAENTSVLGWHKGTKNSTVIYLEDGVLRIFKDPLTWERIPQGDPDTQGNGTEGPS